MIKWVGGWVFEIGLRLSQPSWGLALGCAWQQQQLFRYVRGLEKWLGILSHIIYLKNIVSGHYFRHYLIFLSPLSPPLFLFFLHQLLFS